MPYSIFEINNEYCVFRVDDNGARLGDSLGCHESNDLAGEQIAAIETSEANKAGRVISSKNGNALMQAIRVIADLLRGAGIEPDIDPSEVGVDTDNGLTKEVSLLSQDEAGYVVESPHDPPVACATCKYFIPRNERDDMPACHLVKSVPEPIMPSGWCELYEAREGDEYEAPDSEGIIELDSAPLEKRWLGIIPVGLPNLKAIKSPNGRRLMMQVTSNKWQDRDTEIITAKTLTDYVDSMWTGDKLTGKQKQVFWHMNPNKYPIGNLVWAGMLKGFLVEVFEEEDNILAETVYNAVESTPKGWGSSHGFKYSEKGKDGKVYRAIRKFESTVIPREHAANIGTLSRVLKGSNYHMERSKVLDTLLGIEDVEKILDKEGFDGLAKAMTSAGIPSREKQYTGHKAEGDPPQSAEPTADEAEGAIARLAAKLIESAAGMETAYSGLKATIDELSKRFTKQETDVPNEVKALKEKHAGELATLETRVKALEAAVSIKPRSAVGNEASAALGETLKANLPASATDIDPMFKELGVLKK